MKTKTEAKRQAILDRAAEAFRELGYDKTSMAEICARVGGSKATLYNYFASKDELFYEVMTRSCEAEFAAVLGALDPAADDLAGALQRFGERYLRFLYSQQVRANRHLAIAESGRTALGRLLYERGVLRGLRVVADHLALAMERGALRRADPMLAARQLLALLEAELLDGFLFRLLGEVGDDEIRDVTQRALDVFLAAYRSAEARRSGPEARPQRPQPVS